MQDWINRVFVDGKYCGEMRVQDLAETKSIYRKKAAVFMGENYADHAIYCHIEYENDGTIKQAKFYSSLIMDDNTFYERTSCIPDRDFIGAVHRHK